MKVGKTSFISRDVYIYTACEFIIVCQEISMNNHQRPLDTRTQPALYTRIIK